MNTMSSTEEAVRAWAEGLYPTEAGVELLIRAGQIYDGAPWVIADGDRAWIDVDRLIEHTGGLSGGERRLVDVAASLLSPERPVDLNDAIPGMDRAGVDLVLAAIAHASGSHEHSGFTFQDGQPAGIVRLSSLHEWPTRDTNST